MSRIALASFFAASALLLSSAPAFGQTAAAYDTLALRIESHWSNRYIMRGVDGPTVATAGVFRRANVEQIVAGSPRAETEAKLFRASHRTGSVAIALGALTFAGGVVASANGANSAATPILMIGGLGGVIWGARQLDIAYASLSRAVWWYNRDIGAK
jgi:hypothetical protein